MIGLGATPGEQGELKLYWAHEFQSGAFPQQKAVQKQPLSFVARASPSAGFQFPYKRVKTNWT